MPAASNLAQHNHRLGDGLWHACSAAQEGEAVRVFCAHPLSHCHKA